MQPTTRRKRGLYGHLVHELGQLIVSGGLDNGPIVPEALCHTYDVSRTVVRESLRTLEAKGLISARPNIGTRIRPAADWNLLDADVITWRAHGPHAADQHRELTELRQIIETTAARLAAAQPHDTTRDLLQPAVLRMDEALRNNHPADYHHADTAFHRHLLQAGGNQILQHLHTTITTTDTTPEHTLRCHPDKTTLAHHHTATQAILNHTPAPAEQAIRTLLTLPVKGAK